MLCFNELLLCLSVCLVSPDTSHTTVQTGAKASVSVEKAVSVGRKFLEGLEKNTESPGDTEEDTAVQVTQ